MVLEGRMLYTTRTTLLCTLIVGLGACERGAPTAAPPDAKTPTPAAEVLIVPPTLGRPLPGLSPAQRRQFEVGRVVFQTEFTPETGLGPLFNAVGCGSCHEEPVVGGGGSNAEEGGEDIEVHATAFHAGSETAQCNDLAAVGGQVIQKQLTPAYSEYTHLTSEPIPAAATDSGHRTTPDLFGFGLLDAVPDGEILALADPDDRNGDGISGRPNRTADGRLGRFGRKAQAATLREFNIDAFVMEMGVTNPGNQTEQTIAGEPLAPGIDPVPEPEIGAAQLAAADAFVRFLAPPPRGPLSFAAARGALLFRSVGCASCHVPALVTGANPNPALRFKVVRAFTDLLLHDMGPDLADICLGQALPAEFRTEPLMGLRFKSAFLHDGRATTVEQAIDFHGGEAQASRDRFAGLPAGERAAIVRFLRGL